MGDNGLFLKRDRTEDMIFLICAKLCGTDPGAKRVPLATDPGARELPYLHRLHFLLILKTKLMAQL